jgi:predicted ATPase
MRWGIQDFKGIREGELDLQPGRLTVLTGVNSSGKSSILQSILMATQSLYHSGGIVLNGPLVRLGEPDDLVRTGAANDQIGLRLEIAGADTGEKDVQRALDVQAKLRPSSDKSTLYTARLEFRDATDINAGVMILDKNRSRTADLDSAVKAISAGGAEELLHLKNTFNEDKKELRTYVWMQGLKPVRLIQIADADTIAKRYRSELKNFLNRVADRTARKERTEEDNGRVKTDTFTTYVVVNEFFELVDESMDRRARSPGAQVRELFDYRNANPFKFRDQWTKMDKDVQERVIELAVASRKRRPYVMVSVESPPRIRTMSGLLERRLEKNISNTISALYNFGDALQSISSNVQYLGPLRDEPRVVWSQWDELSKGLPVGTRGEYSAVRLSQTAKRSTKYTRPDGKSVTATLEDAVNEWLSYLEIGESVSAKSVGKLGIRVELKLAGHARDLTAVGVGVSQALPLVVAVLLVPPESVFIVEQPELHLHPAVQARLADFMVGARPDITCLVETHSEAFVTRIRRRVAEGGLDADRVNIMFVEQEASGSSTRTLSVTEFGDLSDWPARFISGDDEDARAILAANISRIGRSS